MEFDCTDIGTILKTVQSGYQYTGVDAEIKGGNVDIGMGTWL